MWIKTHAGSLVNADKLLSIEIADCKTGFQVWGYTANGDTGFILGQYPTKKEAEQAEAEICIKMNHETIMRMPEYKW